MTTVNNFQTPNPVKLYVELMSGEVKLDAVETDETTVTIDGRNVDDVVVTQQGDEISIIGPKVRGLFNFDRGYDVKVTLPLDSQFILKGGSTDIRAKGRLKAAQVKSGSGDVSLDEITTLADIATGSGDCQITTCHGPLTYKTGSGDLIVTTLGGEGKITAGSGDITIQSPGDEISIKTGSSDIRLGEVSHDVTVRSGSSDVQIAMMRAGALVSNSGSGDVRVTVAKGVPVYTDINTVSGAIRSSLTGAGKPEPGQDHIEIRARSASGDITLLEA
jgi:DUF4097 and DUF4098 domain-containing protein YvlB